MTAPPYAYFEHDADYGVIGRGATQDAAFEEAAAAMFAIMDPGGDGAGDVRADIAFEEPDPEFALVTWLNRLLAAAREHNALFRSFHIEHHDGRYSGEARGRRWQAGEDRGTEVKGATLTALSVRETEGGWEVRCVVDV